MRRKGLNSIEIKYVQGQFVTPNTPTGLGAIGTLTENGTPTRAAQISLTSGISRGTARDNRIGNKVFLRHIRFRGLIQASVQAEAVSELAITVLIVRIKDAQGPVTTYGNEVPSVPNIFEFIGNSSDPPVLSGQNGGRGAFINNWNYINSRWKDDFTILKKKTYYVGKPDGTPPLKRFFRMNIPVMKPAFWDDSSNPQDGHLYMYYWCDQVRTDDLAAQAGDRPVMWGAWRTSYTDC